MKIVGSKFFPFVKNELPLKIEENEQYRIFYDNRK